MKVKEYTTFFDTEQLKGDMKKRAIRGGMITSASQGALFVLRLASIMVLARMLIPEHFGLIGMVTSLTVLVERFQDIGLGDAIVQRKDITHGQVSTLFWINLGICLFLTILVVLSAKTVGWFYNDNRLIWITVAFASNFTFSGLAIQQMALIRRRMRYDHFALIKIISTAFGFFIAIILAWVGYGYWALVWKELSRTLLGTILAWFFCPWRPGWPVRKAGVKSMLRFGGNVTGYNILFYLSNNLDSILIGKFCGAVPVGVFTRAKNLTTIPGNQLLEPIKYIALPTLSTLRNDPGRYHNYYEKMLAVISFIYMPIIVYIAIYSHPIVYIALGSQWMDVIPVFRLLAISMFANPIVVLLGMIMLSSGQGKRYLIWGIFTSTSIIGAFSVSIRWGAIGIAASWPIATAINLVFSLFYVFKGTPVGISSTFKNVYRPAIASIIMGILLLFMYKYFLLFPVAFQVLISIFLGSGIYLLVWILFPGGFNKIKEYVSYPRLALRR